MQNYQKSYIIFCIAKKTIFAASLFNLILLI